MQRLRDAQANGDPTLSIASPARAPTGSSLISVKLVLIAALVVGLLIGIAAVMIVDVARVSPQPAPRRE